MLTINDVFELSELSEDEIAAIAEHEHIPQICAAEYGYYLCHTEGGTPALHRIILDDIEAARAAGHHEKAERLRAVLRKFVQEHRELLNTSQAE
ncbi:hypothetical protein SAMN05216241_11142 [Limimonas halophila]|uniref:Uncharacterized protein n=2 Tax=Limimonas halophila TaxID=1082479 RepID=A0A1G7U1W4_9PROT|nr:hypothetical protein SAMN05216241_11142 [Limimonas halophila]